MYSILLQMNLFFTKLNMTYTPLAKLLAVRTYMSSRPAVVPSSPWESFNAAAGVIATV